MSLKHLVLFESSVLFYHGYFLCYYLPKWILAKGSTEIPCKVISWDPYLWLSISWSGSTTVRLSSFLTNVVSGLSSQPSSSGSALASDALARHFFQVLAFSRRTWTINMIFFKVHSVHTWSLLGPKQHSYKYNCFGLIIIRDAPLWGTWLRTLYQFIRRWVKKEEHKAQHPAEPMTSRVSAQEASALPLCYNTCPAVVYYMKYEPSQHR